MAIVSPDDGQAAAQSVATTAHHRFSESTVTHAARRIRDGGLVAVATETVYGLAADATNPQAVAAIYRVKGRPSFNPLIVHVADLSDAERLGRLDGPARRLAEHFWPGPLTLVVPLRPDAGLAPAVTAGLSTLAIRVPRARAIRALLKATGVPLAAPSANRSGHVSPTSADHVRRSLGAGAPMILDDGPCPDGIESTIVSIKDGIATVLRPGPIDAAALAKASGLRVVEADGAPLITAPGQLASHYAPAAPVELDWRGGTGPSHFVIGFGGVRCDFDLSHGGDAAEAAANLYAALHAAEASGRVAIKVVPLDPAAVGPAIIDRLRRAAAPRD